MHDKCLEVVCFSTKKTRHLNWHNTNRIEEFMIDVPNSSIGNVAYDTWAWNSSWIVVEHFPWTQPSSFEQQCQHVLFPKMYRKYQVLLLRGQKAVGATWMNLEWHFVLWCYIQIEDLRDLSMYDFLFISNKKWAKLIHGECFNKVLLSVLHQTYNTQTCIQIQNLKQIYGTSNI